MRNKAEQDESSATTQPLNPPANQAAAAGTAGDRPSSVLVKIERVDRADGPMIRLPYNTGKGQTEHYDFPADKNSFEVPAIVATAAVESGFFRAVD